MRRPDQTPEPGRRPDLEDAVQQHDAALRRRGLTVWLGAEPTFTDRFSVSPEWRTEPLGEDKLNRARRFAARVANQVPGALVLRTVGRQYAGEPTPRWSFGLYARRSGRTACRLPPDPIQGGVGKGRPDWRRFGRALVRELRAAGFTVRLAEVKGALPTRILFAGEPRLLRKQWTSDSRLRRAPLDTQPVPPLGARDELSEQGIHLVALGRCRSGHAEDARSVQLELPRFAKVRAFLAFLECVGDAARRARLSSLVLTGHSPPVDSTVSWTTVTPDPGVLEVNMAPAPDMMRFLNDQRRLHVAAGEVGLSSVNLLYNGEVTDSGGGQHLTFGGSTPVRSPFFEHPLLLPRLIAYVNGHPSLSYWFAGQSVGGSSQQPRSDEVSAESFEGLGVALDLLQARQCVHPEELWSSLAPFLTDRFGNTHRAEINVEKLWNPYVGGRGRLGLVELRACGMTATAEGAAAVAMLFRGVVGMLVIRSMPLSLRRWDQELHDRFALPFYLQRDLEQVLADLSRAGFGLPATVRQLLMDDSRRLVGAAQLGPVRLLVRRAERFWPLTGSLSAPEEASRWVDSSTQRLELLLMTPHRMADELARWRLVIDGMEVPWVLEQDRRNAVALRGVRYKSFHPQLPMLPLVEVREPFEFQLHNGSAAWHGRCHHWQPEGGEYTGLPRDDAEAQRRREERFQVRSARVKGRFRPVPANALAPFTLDLRRVCRRG